jgi:hypothetical protein
MSSGKNFTGNLPLVERFPRLEWRMSHTFPVISGEDLVKYLAKQDLRPRGRHRVTLSCRNNGGSFLFRSTGN